MAYRRRLPLNEQASISGTVWNDANRNGAVDSGEEGIKGVTVTLYQDVNGDGKLDAGDTALSQTYTDSNGGYAFSGLPAGSYIVVENDPPSYISTGDVAGPNDNQIPVSVAAGGKVTGRDFLDARMRSRLYGYAYQDADLSLTRNTGDNACSGMVVQVWQDGVFVAETEADANGFYQFLDLEAATYEVRFICATNALTATPAAGSGAASDIQRNRAVADGANYASVSYTLYPGHGIGADRGEPVNAGFLPGIDPTTASAILIQAYGTPGGEVLVEFESLDETGFNDMVLYLWTDGKWKEVGRLPSTGYGNHTYRFSVAGLRVGDICHLCVRDDERVYHTAYNLPVRAFQVEAVLMTKEGMWLEWNSSPGLMYDIAWCERLGETWRVVRQVEADPESGQTRVFLPREPGAPTGFYRISIAR